MQYDPTRERSPLPYAPFKALTVPRPIGWLSSVSEAGVVNLAPYSQWQNLTFDPPMVMFAANMRVDGRRKDTAVNAEATGWFVWNMATWDLREAVNITAMELEPEVDEFERAGVTKRQAGLSEVPMVAESPAHFECRYHSTHHIRGASRLTDVDVVFATVERIHLDDAYITPEGLVDILKIRPLARIGYRDYTTVDSFFEMQIPEAGDALHAGLAGTPL